MSKIRILPEQVANKIAAGEVIERPASVVKELLENALDAGAKSIRIEVESGGKRLIRVTDDGCGMNHDDALLAFERHATSKLRTADDLLSITTLGFRGEALPTVAAVSHLTLETRTETDAEGTRVEFAGGKLTSVKPAGMPPGTSVSVADLFYCVPARRKFLKSETTELGHIASLATHYALAHPDRHILLKTPSQGYEFELDMLLLTRNERVPIVEQPIQTIYLDGNASSHFNPLRDSMRIYFVLLRFALISMCTAVIDNLLFIASYLYTGNKLTSQAIGRIGAMSFNFIAVKRMVFHTRGRALREFLQYAALVAVSGAISFGLIVFFTTHFSMSVLKAKLVAESILFLGNFLVQRDIIFTGGGETAPAAPAADPAG